ncbi:MAG TPA: site-2 protease family protein [Methylophilaceae bacterium]|nr:site-2 protease family protein [Methylophilaceae bacterium]
MLFELLDGLSALGTVQKITVSAIPVIFAITVHEAAHGYVAKYFGDMTAFQEGRITLNPIKHIDPVGTILIPAITLVLGGILFGWAKPVPVNFSRLRNPKKDMLWVAAAGPASNLVMAIIWALVIKFSILLPSSFTMPLAFMGAVGVMINTVLMVLNLLPLPPLDGGRIAVSLLPHHLAYRYAMVERYGFIILLALLFTGVLSLIMSPFIVAVLNIISKVFL